MLVLPLPEMPDDGGQLMKFTDAENRLASRPDGPYEMGEEVPRGFLEVEVHDLRGMLLRPVQHPLFDEVFVDLANGSHLAARKKPGMAVFKSVRIKKKGGCGPVAEPHVQLLHRRVFPGVFGWDVDITLETDQLASAPFQAERHFLEENSVKRVDIRCMLGAGPFPVDVDLAGGCDVVEQPLGCGGVVGPHGEHDNHRGLLGSFVPSPDLFRVGRQRCHP